MSNSYAYGDYYSDLDSVADDKAPDRYTDPHIKVTGCLTVFVFLVKDIANRRTYVILLYSETSSWLVYSYNFTFPL